MVAPTSRSSCSALSRACSAPSSTAADLVRWPRSASIWPSWPPACSAPGACARRSADVLPAAGLVPRSRCCSAAASGGSVLITDTAAGKWFLFGGAVCAAARRGLRVRPLVKAEPGGPERRPGPAVPGVPQVAARVRERLRVLAARVLSPLAALAAKSDIPVGKYASKAPPAVEIGSAPDPRPRALPRGSTAWTSPGPAIEEDTVHPYLAQAIATERAADLMRAAARHRLVRAARQADADRAAAAPWPGPAASSGPRHRRGGGPASGPAAARSAARSATRSVGRAGTPAAGPADQARGCALP